MTDAEVLLIRGRRHGDDRGWFQETWSKARFEQQGINCDFVQDNHSYSEAAGVVRGLHYQAPPYAQAKLVRCVRGAILDLIVDLRVGTSSYGQVYQVELTSETGDQVLIPNGFAHGFITLRPGSEVVYRVSAPYAPEYEGGLAWDDPALGFDWPDLVHQAQLSPRDHLWPSLAQLGSPFTGTQPSRLREIVL